MNAPLRARMRKVGANCALEAIGCQEKTPQYVGVALHNRKHQAPGGRGKPVCSLELAHSTLFWTPGATLKPIGKKMESQALPFR
jgi:hypothetical protein